MKISVEMTLTPLQNDFEDPIKDYIKQIRKSGYTVLENPLSTQVYGDYDGIMSLLSKEIKASFETLDHCIVTLKIVKSDRSDYVPSF